MFTKKISYYVSVLAIFLIPIFPLIISNSFFFPFITGKAFFFRILVEIAFASWIILAFIDSKYRPKLNPLFIAVTFFALITLLADLLGVNPIRSLVSNFERMEGWLTIVHLWAFFIVISNLFGEGESGKKLWHRFINTSLIVAFIVAMYGVFQLFGWLNIHQGSIRIDASLGNAAYMAVYMMIHAFLAGYMFFVNWIKIRELSFKKIDLAIKVRLWVYGIISILFGFLVFETQTRGTILGLIGGILLALLLYSVFGKSESKKSRLIATSIIGLILVISFVFWLNRNSQFVKDSDLLSRIASISISDVRTQARGYIWPMAINGALERPILGWGQENFNYIFNANYNPKMWMHEQWFDRAHSVFLDWLVAGGFVGLISYLSLYVLFIYVVWRSKLNILEKSILVGLIAGYAIHNVFVFDNLASYVLFFSMLGFVSLFSHKDHDSLFGKNDFRLDAVEYIVAPIVLVLLIISVYFLNIRVMTANLRLIDALYGCSGRSAPDPKLFEKALVIDSYIAKQEIREQLMSCTDVVIRAQQIPVSLKQEFLQLTAKEIENQIKVTPKDARIYVLGGSLMNGVGQYNYALPLLEKANKLTPRKQSAILLLAQLYMNSGKEKEAVDLLKEAYESAPNNSNVRSAYATALVIVGKESEARKMFDNDPSIFESQQMAQTYAISKQYTKAIAVYKTLIKNNPTDVNYRAQLAQVQFEAGLKYDSILTLRALAEDRPDLKAQIEATIKQIEK